MNDITMESEVCDAVVDGLDDVYDGWSIIEE